MAELAKMVGHYKDGGNVDRGRYSVQEYSATEMLLAELLVEIRDLRVEVMEIKDEVKWRNSRDE